MGVVLSALLVALVCAYGTHLLVTAVGFGWRGLGPGSRAAATPGPTQDDGAARPSPTLGRAREWLVQAGLDEVSPTEFWSVIGGLFVLGVGAGALVLGGVVAPILTGAMVASLPVAAYRQRRARRRQEAQEAWPRLIEQIRVLTTSAGRSIPQALFEVGRDGPAELRGAFDAAQREWLLSTDLERTLAVLEAHLADPVADVTCETLLIAHELGGTDLDRRLEDLAADRRADVQDRKDAVAKQAGVRFARRFVLIVPAGMALVGMSVGSGRAAYETPAGQAVVAVALVMIVVCWWWSGRIMRLPDEPRILR
jgi:tight adherence protein B